MKLLSRIGLVLIVLVIAPAVLAQEFLPYTIPDDVEPTPLNIGEPTQGTVNGDAPVAVFALDAAEGQALSFSLISPDFDSELLIIDVDENIIANVGTSENSATDVNIPVVFFPADGTYTVAVTSFDYAVYDEATSEGTFELTVNEAQFDTAAVGETITGELTDPAAGQAFVLELEPTQIVQMTAASEAFDPRLSIYASEGQNFFSTYNDDIGDTLNARVGPFYFFEGGRYALNVTSVEGTGEFTLTVEAVAPMPITPGETQTGAIDLVNTDAFYIFEASAGDVVTITTVATSPNEEFDTSLSVYAPDGTIIAYEFATEEDPRVTQAVELELPLDGSYVIEVDSLSTYLLEPGEPGSYELTLNAG